jgi:ABC-2 type transport system ATP-binding protein
VVLRTRTLAQKSLTSNSGGEFNAVDGISFEAYPHEIFGFLGSNSAGKTTTIKCIMTLTKH